MAWLPFSIAVCPSVCVCCLHRDLRDSALDDASRAKSELRQLRVQHEELLLSSREAASRADVANSQLLGELKLKGFELTRMQVGFRAQPAPLTVISRRLTCACRIVCSVRQQQAARWWTQQQAVR